LLEAAVASLVGRIAGRQGTPGGAGADDPEDGVQDGAVIGPGATGARRVRREEGLEDGPLFIGEGPAVGG
jgi:hypothetical protein